ncbi:MAG TPA: hypothetical protein VGH14_03940 [Solirubrobacterales bacterium]|jgi:hypothetical protein
MGAERMIVRVGIPTLLLASCAGAAVVSWRAGTSEIPGFAFHSHVVLAVQIAILFFYGALLLFIPLVRALIDGDLPVELSLRGARWKEELFGAGDETLARQVAAEERSARAEGYLKEEIRRLKNEFREGALAQEEITDKALRRIKALEEELGVGGSDVKIDADGGR